MTSSMKDSVLEGRTMTACKARIDQNLMTDLVKSTNMFEAITRLRSGMLSNIDLRISGLVGQLESITSWKESRGHDKGLSSVLAHGK